MKKLLLGFLICINTGSYAQYATFTPQVYQPVQHDNSILQRSLEQIERRNIEANEQYKKLQLLLAEYAGKLYNDEETLNWFSNYRKSISEAFGTLMGIGADEARNYAIRKQGELLLEPELNARIRTANEYVEMRQAIYNNSELSWKEKDEWRENHPYCFVPIKDGEGQVIGGRLGSKSEYDDILLRKERERQEAERQAKLQEEMESNRLYNMLHPFDDYDYSAYYKVISYPQIKKGVEDIFVTKVALSDSETRVEFELYAQYQWCAIQRGTFIKTSGSKNLQLLKADNIAISPYRTEFGKPGERLKFALTFPPLPSTAKSFTIEEPIKDGWKFKDIKLK